MTKMAKQNLTLKRIGICFGIWLFEFVCGARLEYNPSFGFRISDLVIP